MRLALCLEQTLGHRAHAVNLRHAVTESPLTVDVVPIEYRRRMRIPWAVEGSWDASRKLRSAQSQPDVLFFHTQSVALFAPLAARGRPFVVSVDATPRQIDEMGHWYGHQKGSALAECLKGRLYSTVFARASAMVAWSRWAADSLVESYGVPRERILIAHPGAPEAFFNIDRATAPDRKPNVLFVGGDLRRKGADLLLQACASLEGRADLTLVTPEKVDCAPGVTVIGNAGPASPELTAAYANADIFCMPTRGDCTPLVLGEAMAAGLPVITSRIGSNAETVSDGVDGLLVAPSDLVSLTAALRRLVDDSAFRSAAGAAARAKAAERFHAGRNAQRVLRLLESVAR